LDAQILRYHFLIEVEVGKKYCRTRNLNYDTIEFYPQMYTKSHIPA